MIYLLALIATSYKSDTTVPVPMYSYSHMYNIMNTHYFSDAAKHDQ